MSYKFDHEWDHERARLTRLEQGMDPGTIAHLETINPNAEWAGWHCLEIGGGGGSIARWLANRVGPTGSVLATDLQTSFLEAEDTPGLTVQQHDIVTDPLPTDQFNLIHCRAVLEHVPDRDIALKKMIAALKPGGWLLLEGHDFCSLQHIAGGSPATFNQVIAGMLTVLKASGFDADYGRHIAHDLRQAGLQSTDCASRAYEIGGDRPLTSVLSLVLKRLQDAMVQAGAASADDIDLIINGLEVGSLTAMSPMVTAAWGQKV